MGGVVEKYLQIIDPLDLYGFGERKGKVVDLDKGPNKAKEQREDEERAAGVNAAAAALEQMTKEAAALADEQAKEAARKKLAQQTQTIFTSGLGLLGTDPKIKRATLGSGE
jgi:arginyl-tRNA synthetase